MIGMKDQCFGVEVEMTGLTRGQAAQALANYFGTEPYYVGGGYDKWSVKDPDGKVWSIMSDSSIVTEMKTESGYMHTSNIEYRVEMVTPKLTYAELPRLQECVRQVRHAGAKVNHSCGIHVHVDAANHNRQSLKNLLSIMYSKEDILFKALQVNSSRVSQYCQKVREPMLKEARKLSSDFFLTFICFIFNRNSSTAPFVKPHCVLIVAAATVLLINGRLAHTDVR